MVLIYAQRIQVLADLAILLADMVIGVVSITTAVVVEFVTSILFTVVEAIMVITVNIRKEMQLAVHLL
jgi:hypothetical protein